MLRPLFVVIALALVGAPAEAQVFRPKAGKKTVEKKATPAADPAEKKAAKKQPRAAPTKKRPAKKKNAAADRARADDEESAPEPKGGDKDYVKIWDDDEIE